MRFAFGVVLVVAAGLTLLSGAQGGGQDKKETKEVTIKGSVCCAKCSLAKETSCMTVIAEKKDGKEVVYYFDKAGHTKWHDDICGAPKDGSVTGVVTEKDGKKTIEVKEVKYGN
jgi:hypothetical protein